MSQKAIDAFVTAADEGRLPDMTSAKVSDVNAIGKLGRLNEHGTALLWASGSGDQNIVQYLLAQKGIDVDRACTGDDSPLVAASASGHTEVAKLLIKAGANVEHRGHGGRTALLAAGINGHAKTVKYLIGMGANLTHFDDEGHTVMDLAVTHNLEEVVCVLEPHGVPLTTHETFVKYLEMIGMDYIADDEMIGE
jgi:ankyrin repeat protein